MQSRSGEVLSFPCLSDSRGCRWVFVCVIGSRQTKLAVADRTRITTTEDETRVIEPATLQAAIDALVATFPSVRVKVNVNEHRLGF